MIFKWRLKKYFYNGQIYYMPQRKGWIFWNNATWDEYRRVIHEKVPTSSTIQVNGLANEYVAFANIEDAKRLIEALEKYADRKRKYKELDEYIYINDSISKELKK